eukprot:NODE_503_length_2982_cov_63.584588.p1 GENE.NODE_503_length_2982_cov_63.584588~~NODE_503_length_2982_cov_63.584588.p1  ORF type:complete len:827 (-),score=234.66 NODE_503_length_2982_cov_63.584588:275-2755(-)
MSGALTEGRLQNALKQELPTCSFDSTIVKFVVEAVDGIDNDTALRDAFCDALTPFLYSLHAASDDEGAREMGCAVLSRLMSDGGSTTAASDAGPGTAEPLAAAQAAAHTPPTASATGETVRGLYDWLDELRLKQYESKALEWCDQMGAAEVDEVIENWQDFCDELSLKCLERNRVQKKCEGGQKADPQKGTAPASVPKAAAQTPPTDEAVRGLYNWLDGLRLTQYENKAVEWCDQMGAADVDEVIENWQDLCDVLSLKPLERKRIQKKYEDGQKADPAPTPKGPTPAAVAKTAQKKIEDLPIAPPPKPKAQGNGSAFGANGKYRLIEEIGAGATATVYRCLDTEDNAYAVKALSLGKLKLHADYQSISEKLHREMQILFSLRHQNIVSLYDVEEQPETLFLVMELVEGGELFDYIVRTGCLREPQARYVFLQLTEALIYIHSKGIVHRDLKPENILVSTKESRGELLSVKISDFGHSKLIDDGYSVSLTRVGTPQYWAPEVSEAGCSGSCRGYDERVDLWSLGVVLYVMLEGTYPFSGINSRIEDQIRKANFQFKSGRASSAAEELVRSLIRRKPADRLPLKDCQTHRWVSSAQGPLRNVMKVNRGIDHNVEEHFQLPGEPPKVKELKLDLQRWTKKHRIAAVLRKQVVVVTWGDPAKQDTVSTTRARQEIRELLLYYFQALKLPSDYDFTPPEGEPELSLPGKEPLATVKETAPMVAGGSCSSAGAAIGGAGGNKNKYGLREVRLNVVDNVAGLDLKPERGGMRIVAVHDTPGQPGVQAEDLIVKIDGQILGAGNPEDKVQRIFGEYFRDGAILTIKRPTSAAPN